MKAKRRNFIVEIKSSRRQPKARPHSIWGNIDFKALAEQSEHQTPLPGENLTNESIRTNEHTGMLIIQEVSREHIANTSSFESTVVAPVAGVSVDNSVRDCVDESVDEVAGVRSGIDDLILQPTDTYYERSEIGALETQNIRLMRLLIARLREENARLKGRLAQSISLSEASY
ncbi:hypothetical protein LJR245_007576 [Rhizobium leguminosarum]|uniref:hypothetical protein n=1 Tax=Rhizobium leguminosarum TaxID=384 RepID=UPI003ECDE6BB